MKIRKQLCNLDRHEIKEHLNDLTEVVLPVRHICRKCARVSSKKKYLCKPATFPSVN